MTTNIREEHAVTFVELVEKLVEIAVRDSIGPGQCIAALKVAATSLSLELPTEVVQAGRAFGKDFATVTPEGALRGMARRALAESEKATPEAIPEPALQELVRQATNAITAIDQKDGLAVLIALHMASHISMAVMKSQSTEDELALKLTRFLTARRMIARIEMDVQQLGPMTRGGSA